MMFVLFFFFLSPPVDLEGKSQQCYFAAVIALSKNSFLSSLFVSLFFFCPSLTWAVALVWVAAGGGGRRRRRQQQQQQQRQQQRRCRRHVGARRSPRISSDSSHHFFPPSVPFFPRKKHSRYTLANRKRVGGRFYFLLRPPSLSLYLRRQRCLPLLHYFPFPPSSFTARPQIASEARPPPESEPPS